MENLSYRPGLMRFLFLSHIFLINKLQRLKGLVERREEELDFLKNDSEEQNDAREISGKKRIRKKKDAVSREFCCVVDSCGKAYGSENSLN